MLLSALATLIHAQTENTLVITAGTQTGFFRTRSDIGSLNPHDYRPNEFVTNDFIFEGLVAWDGEHTAGVDGISGNDDDFVKPSLAASWVTNRAAVEAAPTTPYEITFTLRSGVTFHDGSAWNAAAAKANFDQIMGGNGASGGTKALKGLHDWLGFTQSLDAWAAVDSMTFKLTFTSYYESALRELAIIRPFRMISIASLPNMGAMEVSHNKWRGGAPRVFGGYTMRGVSSPIGTGPYKVVDKLLVKASGESRRLPAAGFNASCYTNDVCTYNAGEWVSEVLFQKVAHWKNPSYDNVIFRAYNSIGDVKTALLNGTLDVAYGVNVLSPGGFLSLATAEQGADVVAHKSKSNLNTRLIVLNSGGRLNTVDLRKLVMGILAPGRQALYDGELAEEQPTDKLFDPTLPYCGVLSSLSSPSVLAATKSPTVTTANITRPLRFMYIKDIPHQQIIAAEIIATLYTHGIAVTPIPVTKEQYNGRHCWYLSDPNGTFPYWYSYKYDGDGDAQQESYHAWDIAYSETWGPPYDSTSKLWDMTHGLAGWCSQEADAPAVSNMESMNYATFVDRVRNLSTILDATARQAAYTEVLTTLHNEAIFLPMTHKRQTAVTNKRVSGFQFGYMEYDLPLANLSPTTGHSSKFSVTIAGNLADISDAKKESHKTAMSTQLGVHKSSILITYTSGSVVMTVEVKTDTASGASAVSSTMAGLTTATLSAALGETVTAISEPTNTNTNTSTGISDGGIAGIAAGSAAFGALLLFMLFVISREKQGKPIFMSLNGPPAAKPADPAPGMKSEGV